MLEERNTCRGTGCRTVTMIPLRSIARTLIAFLCGMTGPACLLSSAHAQDPNSSLVHWAYSSYFGTGWYEVADDRDVYILRAAPRWELRAADLSENSERTLGVELRLSMTAGLDSLSLDDIPDAIDLDNFASLSVAPEINITVPVTDRWTLRPYASVGWGRLLNSSESAWTYWAGIKSRYTFSKGKLDWALVNQLGYVGYSPSLGSSEDFWPVMSGLEFDYPLANYELQGEQLFASWHGTYTSFASDLNLDVVSGSLASISDQWEFGFSLHKKDTPIKIAWFGFDRLGLAYRFSSSGDLKGISLVLRSAFDR